MEYASIGAFKESMRTNDYCGGSYSSGRRHLVNFRFNSSSFISKNRNDVCVSPAGGGSRGGLWFSSVSQVAATRRQIPHFGTEFTLSISLRMTSPEKEPTTPTTNTSHPTTLLSTRPPVLTATSALLIQLALRQKKVQWLKNSYFQYTILKYSIVKKWLSTKQIVYLNQLR